MQLAKWFSILSLIGFSTQTFAETKHGTQDFTNRPVDANPNEVFSYPIEPEDQQKLAALLEEFSPSPRPTGEIQS